MGSYENIVKIEEIRKKVDEGDLQTAQKVLDTMELKKIKNTSDLNLLAEVYAGNERYEEAVDLYLKIYEKVKSRKSLFQLIEIYIKLNQTEDAESFLLQYQKIAPKDFYNDIFRFKIDKMKGESSQHLIEILENLKRTEYLEKWAYELAKLYYKAGMEKECIRECSDIELWFGDGTFVEKAKILKSYYSSDTDKEKIMEIIKQRAEAINTHKEEDELVDGSDIEQKEESPYEDTDYPESSYDMEGDTYLNTDFFVGEENEDFVYGLKKDVQDIMTNEDEEDEEDATYEEDSEFQNTNFNNIGTELSNTNFYEVEPNSYEEESNSYEEEPNSNVEGPNSYEEGPNSYEEEPTYYEEEEVTEDSKAFSREAEPYAHLIQEVENHPKVDEDERLGTSVEESFDEDDIKLQQIAIEYQISPEDIFGNFLHIVSIKKQLVKNIDSLLQERSKNLMMMITGTDGSGKTTLAKDMALFFFQTEKLKSAKVAKIKADKLNTVDIMSKKDTLTDCCLVIENASDLQRKTIDDLLKLIQTMNGDIAVIFEENKKNINKLFRECPKLMDLLKNRIHLPQYTGEDLVGFAYACLRQKEYDLHPKAEQILMGKINQIAKQSEPHRHLEQIYDLMQSAMNAADIRVGKQLTSLASQGRLQDVELLTVLAEDLK